MPWWTWLALAVFLAGVTGGTAWLAVAVVRAARRARTAERNGLTAAVDVLERVEALAERLDSLAAGSSALDARLRALRRSLARLALLLRAFGDARATLLPRP